MPVIRKSLGTPCGPIPQLTVPCASAALGHVGNPELLVPQLAAEVVFPWLYVESWPIADLQSRYFLQVRFVSGLLGDAGFGHELSALLRR